MDLNVNRLLRPEIALDDMERSMAAQSQSQNGFDLGKFLLGLLFVAVFWFVLSYVVQWAWNASVTEIFPNIGALSQQGALALVVLIQILTSRVRM